MRVESRSSVVEPHERGALTNAGKSLVFIPSIAFGCLRLAPALNPKLSTILP